MATGAQTDDKDVFILGPALRRDNGVLEAIYSLQYLPPHYQLILPEADGRDDMFHGEIVTHIQKNALGNRVHFVAASIAGAAPEAYASTVLKLARTGA